MYVVNNVQRADKLALIIFVILREMDGLADSGSNSTGRSNFRTFRQATRTRYSYKADLFFCWMRDCIELVKSVEASIAGTSARQRRKARRRVDEAVERGPLALIGLALTPP